MPCGSRSWSRSTSRPRSRGSGSAKIALGWPLWVASLAVMGWMLVAGHTPLEAEEGPGALEHGEGPDGVGSS